MSHQLIPVNVNKLLSAKWAELKFNAPSRKTVGERLKAVFRWDKVEEDECVSLSFPHFLFFIHFFLRSSISVSPFIEVHLSFGSLENLILRRQTLDHYLSCLG